MTQGNIFQGMLLVLVFFQGLAMFEVNITSLWVVFSSSLLALTFIFGPTTNRYTNRYTDRYTNGQQVR